MMEHSHTTLERDREPARRGLPRALLGVATVGLLAGAALVTVALVGQGRRPAVVTPLGPASGAEPGSAGRTAPPGQGILALTEDGRVLALGLDGRELRTLYRRPQDVPPGGTHAYLAPDRRSVYLVNRRPDACGEILRVPFGGGQVEDTGLRGWDPAPSPDGERLAYVQARQAGGRCEADLVVRDLRLGLETRFPSGAEADGTPQQPFEPVWSPDGSRIAVTVGGENPQIRILDPSRPGPLAAARALTPPPGEQYGRPSYGPQGLTVLALCCGGVEAGPKKFRLVQVDERGAARTLLTFPEPVLTYAFDPSGGALVWVTAGGSLWRSAADGSGAVRLREGVLTAAW